MLKPYYEQDGITIFHGDCRDILPTFPDKSFDLVLTDPPFGVGLGKHSDAREKRAGVGLKKQGYASYDDTHDNLISVVVPAIESCFRLSDRVMTFCAGTKIRYFPEPDTVGYIFPRDKEGRGGGFRI